MTEGDEFFDRLLRAVVAEARKPNSNGMADIVRVAQALDPENGLLHVAEITGELESRDVVKRVTDEGTVRVLPAAFTLADDEWRLQRPSSPGKSAPYHFVNYR